jgi:hypothetical protein
MSSLWVLALAGLCASPVCCADFPVSVAGKPQSTIIVAAQSGEAVAFAARELADYLERIVGAPFPVRTEPDEAQPGYAIHVGPTRQARATIDLAAVPREGFVIRTAGRSLYLTGSDEDGTQFAVYEFLERFGGVRWFWPGAWGDEAPERREWILPEINIQQSPWFRRRTMSLLLRGAPAARKEHEAFGRRWKLGSGVKTVGVHAWGQIAPPAKYGPDHPEYFALVNGTRERDWTRFDGSHEYQLCTTHPDVIRLSIEWARKYFDLHPDTDILSISPNDGLGFCECERCRRLDTGAAQSTGDNPFAAGAAQRTQTVISDRIFTYANAVASGVAATHPSKSVLMLAYSSYRQPPQRVKPHPNLVVQFADNADFHADPARKADRVSTLEEWARLTPNLMIYEYYVWGANLPARILTHNIAESLARFQRLGIRLFRSQSRGDFGLNGVNYYVAAKLLWNPSLDPDALLDGYCRSAFGPAAKPMRSYFDLLEERWNGAVRQIGARYTPQNLLYSLAAYDPASRSRMRALLQEASRRCSTKAQCMRVDFFAQAHAFSLLTVEAAERTTALENAGMLRLEAEYPSIFDQPTRIVELKPPSTYSTAQRRLLADAVAKWEERERFLVSIEGRGIVDTGAARAHDRYYRLDSLPKLREIQAALTAPQ